METLPNKNGQASAGELPDETIEALENLCLVLKPIYLRMKREGYDIVNGKLTKIK